MAEPNHARIVALASKGAVDAVGRVQRLFSTPNVVVQTAGATGYGLWMVLGAALALGLYPDGRGEVLAPLSIGLILVGSGLVATCLRLPFAPEWHGWNPVKRMMPTLEGMVAMVNFLPMLALAGLARGENDFWATRLAGAALTLCSLATLVYTARGASRDLPGQVASVANALPLGRTVSALFAGGLWFWLCIALQAELPPDPLSPWRLALLAVALALGVVEGMRWRALRQLAEERGGAESITRGRGSIADRVGSHRAGTSPTHRAASLLGWRFTVAVLSIGLPCLLLIAHPGGPLYAVAAGLAALSCVIGQCLEQRFYGLAFARLTAGPA